MGEIPRVPRLLQSAVMNNTVDRKILVSWDSDVHIFNENIFLKFHCKLSSEIGFELCSPYQCQNISSVHAKYI